MANKNILLGMLTITLVFGLTFMGCDIIKGDEEGDNSYKESFKGTWFGTFTPSGGEEKGATITFSDTRWTLTAAGINQSGPYEKSSIPNTVNLIQSSIPIGAATVVPILGTLSVNFILGEYNGSSGRFNSSRDNTGEFNGTWTGTFTPTGSGAIEGATIKFEDATWNLIAGGSINISGTYSQQIDSNIANLMQGGIPVGAATIVPLAGTLALTFLPTADTKGTGSFNSGTHQGDSFVGTWTGTYKLSGGEDKDATIVFTENRWTLTATGISETGTYEKTSLLPNTATANLIQSGGITIGTVTLLPVVRTLTVNILLGSAIGSGSFERQ
jgi:hypothetical protein